jgi:hypothetical protein
MRILLYSCLPTKLIIACCFMLCSQLKESLVVLEEKVMNVMEFNYYFTLHMKIWERT